MITAVVHDVPRRLNTVRQRKSSKPESTIRISQHSRECLAPTRPVDRATSAVPPLVVFHMPRLSLTCRLRNYTQQLQSTLQPV